MTLPKIQEARKLSNEELDEKILLAKKQIFDLRVKKATRQSFKPHLFRHTRRKISQLLSVKSERKNRGKIWH
uniref:Large ribosomal subunit protein uL29c n=1 Tax=Gronococcus sybilensis TaxID=3028029 RepID=A0A9Y1I2P8_9RHOD|nr:ribosomal protein L29 [Gronococcus sybilensis]